MFDLHWIEQKGPFVHVWYSSIRRRWWPTHLAFAHLVSAKAEAFPFCKQPTDTLNNPFHDGHLDSSNLPRRDGLTAAFQLDGGERLPSRGQAIPLQQHGRSGAHLPQRGAYIHFGVSEVRASGRMHTISRTWAETILVH